MTRSVVISPFSPSTTAVTSSNASITGGTATAGTPTFSGNEMRVPLTGVANKQIVPIHISGVNDGTATADVPFGFLIADADASRVVDKPDRTVIQGQLNQPVTSANFRDDVNRDGRIKNNDVNLVKTHRGESIPYRHYVLESSYPTPGKF